MRDNCVSSRYTSARDTKLLDTTDSHSLASIEKLKIQGVRSFDNARSEYIHFQTPLTLIVGDNGSGKTTIIECLKYASTGILPPNSKGGAFVHEPKLCGEKEVLAQVKLQFKDAKNSKLVVTRSLMLTVKKNSRSATQIDCNFLMIRDGERTNLSKRVMEMDKIVPKYLAVSPAILESVIFCHQDESLWPMSEPGPLKKKFDEIFEAMKYTKAIDQLKTVRKNQTKEIGELKIHEDNCRINKEKADKVAKRSTALQDEIEVLTKQLEDLKKEVRVAAQDQKDKEDRAHSASTVYNELQASRTQARYLEENLANLRKHMKEMTESDEWLESTLAHFDQRMLEYKKEEADLRAQYTKLNEAAKAATEQLSKKQSEKGQHLAEKASFDRNLESRLQLVKEAAHQHSLRGYDGDLEDDQIRDFVGRIEKLSKDKDRELDALSKKTDEELQSKQEVLTSLATSRTSKTQEKVAARQTIASNDKKMNLKQNEAGNIKVDEGTLAALEASLNESKARLDQLNKKYADAAWDVNIRKETKLLRELQAESSRLRNDLFESNKVVGEQARLQVIKKELKDRQTRLDTMKATYNDQLASVVGGDWEADSLEHSFQAAMDDRVQAVRDAKKRQDAFNQQLTSIEYKLKTSSDSLRQKKLTMQQCQKEVMESICLPNGDDLPSVDDYPAELADLEIQCQAAQKNLDGADYVMDYYKKGQEIINVNNACRLCARPFADSKEKASALEKIQKELARIAKDSLTEAVQQLGEDLRVANGARLQYENYKLLSDKEIPSLEKTVQTLESEKATLVAQAEKQDSLVRDVTAAKEDGDALSKTVAAITNYCHEISKYETDIARLSSQQSYSGSTLSNEEINQQSNECEEKINKLNSKIDKLVSEEKQAMAMITALDREVSQLNQESGNAKHQLEKRNRLAAEVKEYRDSTSQLREAIRVADVELESLAPQFAKASAQLDEVKRRGRHEASKLQKDKDSVANTVNKFRAIETAINRYVESNGSGKLAACERAIHAIEQDQKRLEKEIAVVTKKNNDVNARSNDSENSRRTIEENVRYRKGRKDIEAIHHKIADLESQNVDGEHEQLHAELQYATQNLSILEAKKGPIMGALTAKDQELQRYIAEWEIDYKDAADKYRETHLKLEVTKAACDDLGKYGSALDSAIMQYHATKMEAINSIATDLWQRTYQGTDVDGILIRSDAETVKTNRTYNYRVVMVKGEVEMDMRGRCSAGQKVLACIIIRLALAECFGQNCGVIALDEPTTNLDTDNIKALAQSLNQLIKARRQQSNFQIIIITHDEEFLREMQPSDFTESYWQVSRDREQKSSIKNVNISALMD
ncbi:P-loop containing nucleoside triphosphate hydrolase [Glarea lozoyensis ATCC 20868]|uniref:DNA repair protein RAD50 n=1 Tax=Glarea lozoyensis (strain ATCC 20868 / MF5171) TaxID=1116229 RepID=S3DT49_GLAL2|nr:P-loop containing nucleoside triphosphate hydrolase [Glarea lozoyensis ATCC 20868]EPE35141.1 P-loop containing nucleoside triphosphate hydrolase [Glarea lozoyensis ATCC 20868]